MCIRDSLSLTYKVLTTKQPQYLHNLISVQPYHNTRSSSMSILSRPSTRSSLKITNRSLQYAAPYLWNELPTELGKARQILSPSRSRPITHGSSSSLSPLTTFIISHSFILSFWTEDLALWQILSTIDLFLTPTGLILRTLCPFNVFILLKGWICLYSVLD